MWRGLNSKKALNYLECRTHIIKNKERQFIEEYFLLQYYIKYNI